MTDLTANQSLEKLIEGNQKYLNVKTGLGDVSLERRLKCFHHGQHPYAIVITCSDARVVPDAIFSAGIGDLFVIRVAGNVIDDHQLGSIEYAAEHLGCHLIVVLGHNHCGAVDAAINHDPQGYIKFITDEIKIAIGEEKDEYKACVKNVMRSLNLIESSLEISKEEHEHGLKVIPAMYDLETGKVNFDL